MAGQDKPKAKAIRGPTSPFVTGRSVPSVPILCVASAQALEARKDVTAAQKAWARTLGFQGGIGKFVALPDASGGLSAIVFGIGDAPVSDPMMRPEVLLGSLATQLPMGTYHLGDGLADPFLASVAWGLGSYKFRVYKTANGKSGAGAASEGARLKLPDGADSAHCAGIVDGMTLARDLINIPSNDMGPEQLEHAARTLAERHGAKVTSIVGDELLAKNFPMIHAVGRASPRAPRLIDMTWGRPGATKVTLVGKGVCFDTGGLDLKPSASMLLMKKDMGGAAAVLGLAHMIMSAKLNVRLRVLIPAVENSVSGDAFRPSDVLMSRSGRTVEIGNTDAEGRLVLADALSLADEESPDTLLTFATLTGAARVALGPELPPFFTDDDTFAKVIAETGLKVADPVWRMPFWTSYESYLDSPVADMNNVSDGPFAGAVTAALFLRKFVKSARRFAHFDIYGWRPAQKPLGPRGGEAQAARAIFALLEREQS
jgi:leucyl aminopeptidase